MTISSKNICAQFSELICGTHGEHTNADSLNGIEHYSENSLVFLSNEAVIKLVEQKTPAIIITTKEIAEKIKHLSKTCILVAHNVRVAQAIIKQAFDDYDASDAEWAAIHASAIIHESANIGENVRIGPNVVIGANVTIGNDSIIRSNSVIEHDAVIGNNCVIHSLVNLGLNCKIGNNVILHSACTIGGEGFGLAQDHQKKYHRIPHTGDVIIEDDVQIGSGCNIDRGTYGSTIIRQGTKIDAHCHIAHNVEIGENTLLVAQCGIAGSSKIGNNVIMSGRTAVLDHKSVVDNAVLVHKCGVSEDITEPGMWAGTPARPFREYVKSLGADKKIDKLSKRIRELEKQLNDK